MNIKHLLRTTANNVELGMEIERARIIGLLKGMHPAFNHDEDMCFVCEVITLIKD